MKSLNADFCGDTPSGEFRLSPGLKSRLLKIKNKLDRQRYNSLSLHMKVLTKRSKRGLTKLQK